MSVPGHYWIEVQANGPKNNAYGEVHTPVFAPHSVRAHSMLLNVNHTDAQESFAADCFISRYIQGGQEESGHWRAISGDNITEVWLRMNVNGCSALGGVLVELF